MSVDDWIDWINGHDWIYNAEMGVLLAIFALQAVALFFAMLFPRPEYIDITDDGMKAEYRLEARYYTNFFGRRHLVPKGQNLPYDSELQSRLAERFGFRIVMGTNGKGFRFNKFCYNKDQRAIIKAKLKEFYNLDIDGCLVK